jgi:hypothetical protein
MALVKYNNNSISAVTSAASIPSGAMTLIKTLTASSSSTLSFVDGSSDVVLDSTYPIYVFKFINIHASATGNFTFQGNAAGASGFNETMTTTSFVAYHDESDSTTALEYNAGGDIAQGTGFQYLNISGGFDIENSASLSGTLTLFDPSSTTFVKHFIANAAHMGNGDYTHNSFVAGYFNVTSAIDEIQFKMSSGNIDAGTIKLYGIKDS